MKRTKEQYEKEIERQMAINQCSYEDAKSIVDWDDAIDAGDKELGAPTPEQKKMLRQLHKADKDPGAKTERKPRERKVDEDKKKVFSWLHTTLEGFALNGEITITAVKNETEVTFMHGDAEYTMKLTKHRAKK